ncbi:hypothetical protein BB558_007159, partial [Smittium angustum]
MSTEQQTFFRSLFRRKPIRASIHQGEVSEMKRVLTAIDLVGVGIGSIIGTGIFVLTGRAAAVNAGPAIVISFVIAGVVSAISAFSYAEMGSMIPIAGSAYTYALTTMGELFGWIVGWDLMLELLVGGSTVAVGWSGYLVHAFQAFWGVTLNKATTETPLEYRNNVFVINE